MLLKYLGFCGSNNASSSKKHYPTVIEELCHEFSLEDIRKSTNNFDEKLVIGGGSFGKVYKGCLKHNGATDYTIAVKRLRCKTTDFHLEFSREIELLCQLRHPNLVSLIGFCNHEKEKIIVYEYMPNGSLHDHLHSRDMERMSWKKRLEICIGVARGLHYLHNGVKRIILHRDIKPHNILLDNNMMPKLSDFGLSLQGPLSTSKPKLIESLACGTLGYIAPEVFLDMTVSDKSDVYSFGMVLLEVICTTDIDKLCNNPKVLASQQWWKMASELRRASARPTLIMREFLHQFPVEEMIDPVLNGKIAPECWQVFADTVQRCLKYEPDERPTMGEVEVLLEHALSLQEEADIRKTDGDYTLLSTTYFDLGWPDRPI